MGCCCRRRSWQRKRSQWTAHEQSRLRSQGRSQRFPAGQPGAPVKLRSTVVTPGANHEQAKQEGEQSVSALASVDFFRVAVGALHLIGIPMSPRPGRFKTSVSTTYSYLVRYRAVASLDMGGKVCPSVTLGIGARRKTATIPFSVYSGPITCDCFFGWYGLEPVCVAGRFLLIWPVKGPETISRVKSEIRGERRRAPK